MGKLVRDKIPDLIRGSSRKPDVRTLDPEAYRTALHDKLLEEAGELRSARTSADVIEEIADLLEVLTALAALHGATLDDVVAAAAKKRTERGAFRNHLWLETADTGPTLPATG